MDKIDIGVIDQLFKRMQVNYQIELSSYDSVLHFLTKFGMVPVSKEKQVLARLISNLYLKTESIDEVQERLKMIKEKVPDQFKMIEEGKAIKEYFLSEWEEWLDEKEKELEKGEERVPETVHPFQTFHDIKGNVKIFTRYPAGTVIDGVRVGGRIITHT
jgi:predicted RNA-binding protein with EMAP domain